MYNKNSNNENDNFRICDGFMLTISLISGKYKMIILYILYKLKSVRYNELKRIIGDIYHKTLSSALKELEKDDLIIRKDYNQIPRKVEYSLSKNGKSLIPILKSMSKWGENNRKLNLK